MGFVVFLVVIVGVIGTTVGYMLPSIIAFRNEHEHRWLILFANVFSGWTGVAWFPLLLWACRVFGGPGLERPDFQAVAMKRTSRKDPQPILPSRIEPPALVHPRPTVGSPGRQSERPLQIRPRAGW